MSTSATSNNWSGSFDLALVCNVLSIGARRVDLPHSKSADFELPICTTYDASVRFNIVVVSCTEHNTKLRHSTKPQMATSSLTISPNLFKIHSPPIVRDSGRFFSMLLYPYAIPISSAMSHYYKMSVL